MNEKLYIVRKYIMAKSAKDAILKDRKQEVDDIWVDEDWKKAELDKGNLGFNIKK